MDWVSSCLDMRFNRAVPSWLHMSHPPRPLCMCMGLRSPKARWSKTRRPKPCCNGALPLHHGMAPHWYAKPDDIGIVHKVVITSGSGFVLYFGQKQNDPGFCNEGFVLMSNGCYNLHSWSPVRQEHVRLSRASTSTEPITVRVTTVSLREPRVGDVVARWLQKIKHDHQCCLLSAN